MTIFSIGEILWDVFPDGEHLGGAPFNLAAHARRLGHRVYFVSAVGEDERGSAALARMRELQLPADFVRRVPGIPTGTVSVQLDRAAQPAFTIRRPAAYDFVDLDNATLAALSALRPDWICFGTLQQMSAPAKRATARLLDACPEARRFYDINLRPECYTAPLVRELLAQASVVKLNDGEMEALSGMLGEQSGSIETFCRANAARFGCEGACVTRGAQGCAIWLGEEYVEVAGYPIEAVDTVGAGDAFSAAFLHGFGQGWPAERIGDFANRVGALVASRRGAIPSWSVSECEALGQ